MNIPPELKYTDSHEWIKPEGTEATVGITDHAQNELSDVVFVELPEIGKKLSKGSNASVVESVKAASDIYSPVAGEVIAVNDALKDNPSLINSSPYEQGWIFKIKVSDAAEIASLKDSAAYAAML